eukprot:TRINITY_DN1144_c0_g1_i2.p2 TRINITY_DN1144_c0_g1~~TRINITY_DN1144_c0_g1_i2.p2  ORF type:complete len:191 (+),score=39.26 TRINITY_DN1144_c0_g1_i2:1032-1604(+)
MLKSFSFAMNSSKLVTIRSHSFNYIVSKSGYTFLCVADKEHKTQVCFAFLRDLETNFQPAAASRFKSHIKKQMQVYSQEKEVDKISAIKTELEDVKTIMRENIDKVVQRGEKLDDLEAVTAELETNAATFRTGASKLKTEMWLSSMKMKIVIGVVVTLVLFVIIWMSCGVSFERCGNAPPPSPASTPTTK